MDPTSSGIAWDDSVIWPILKASVRYIQREHHVTTLSPGEESLNSMHDPNAGDREPRYLANGVVRATKLDYRKRPRH